ncbi:MAG TPA: hypothetical protein VHL54_01320, partial [Actinomycetota bacterium]|nr:hypothetical protein [Actinomycetota bacterium]
ETGGRSRPRSSAGTQIGSRQGREILEGARQEALRPSKAGSRSPGAVVSLRVECPAGKKGLSAGFDVEGDVPYNSGHAYRDNPTLTGTNWNIMVANENNWVERETLPGRLRGWAVCANVA